MKIVILLKENWSHMDNDFRILIGVATENGDFQSEIQRLEGYKKF